MDHFEPLFFPIKLVLIMKKVHFITKYPNPKPTHQGTNSLHLPSYDKQLLIGILQKVTRGPQALMVETRQSTTLQWFLQNKQMAAGDNNSQYSSPPSMARCRPMARLVQRVFFEIRISHGTSRPGWHVSSQSCFLNSI